MADALTTVGEWQDFLDENFPDGCLVTQILYSEDAAYTDESPQVLMSSLRVIDVENETPLVSCKFAGMDRDMLISVEKFEDRDFGFHVVTAEDDTPNFLFSRNISDTQRQAVASEREQEGDTS